MKLNLKMTLLTDTIFGNGLSIPGGEDSSVLCDQEGFPYYKGGSFKGIFREELENLMSWSPEYAIDIEEKLGISGSDEDVEGKIRFSDFMIPSNIKKLVRENIDNSEDVLDSFTYLRTFTKLNDEGMASKGSLRNYRCIKAGVTFTSQITCFDSDKEWIEEVLGLIKWVGTMRNRGFGKVKIVVVE
ncbi:protein of unknown function DUF324 [Lachnospiraceae bacterium TWA4]|nr:protein of unknown function DUF324 [Lachnospiraceae bacterium TWA4]